MHVARVPDFPPPIDQIAYVRAASADQVDLDVPPPPASVRRRSREWTFGLAGMLLGAAGTAIVATSVEHEGVTREATPAVAKPVVAADLEAHLGWHSDGVQREPASNGYRNPLPLLLLGRP